ncbi:MAG: hypothetical protein M0R33_05945 [Methylomonas sp.]|jgi:hypothetical protein|uniref:hypothetical protein n=1 Tax=Methylomonas sp. TaxID=418 RepID=UPI0025CED5F8|nr:hypothetical protein [Methylomonas sp.]MCK9605978.1 hypothetical protein [Methylomonas sp.]
MLIDTAATKSQASHYLLSRIEGNGRHNFFKNRSEIGAHRHREHDRQDQLKLSDAGKLAATQKSPVDLEKKPDATHTLNIQIIQSMVKSITGQDLRLFTPQALRDQADQVTVQAPTQAPDTSANSDTGLVYQQSMSSFETQTITFNAQGSINTKDGKSIHFSVSLSMSHVLYTETNLDLQTGDTASGAPLSVDFEGNSAELTATHFEFALDTHGSQGQVNSLKSTNARQIPVSKQADTGNHASESDNVEQPSGNDSKDSQLLGMAKFVYQQLRIWQRHADGSQQLLALGEKNLGALYLGHLNAPLQSKTTENKPTLLETADGNMNLPQNNQADTPQQINFTA